MVCRRQSWLLVCWLAGVAACDGDGALEPTTESLQRWVFTPHCANDGCHGSIDPASGLDLHTEESSLRFMVNIPPSVGTAAASFPAIVRPGSPEDSFLVAKVTHPGLDHGLPMPPTDQMLTEEAVDSIRAWIASMAP
jgi:hypothetical protein